MFAVDDLAAIARRAGRLADRIDDIASAEQIGSSRGDQSEAEAEPNSNAALRREARLELWRAEAAAGKPEPFRKRLAWDAIREGSVHELLSDEWPAAADSAKWLRFLGGLSIPDDSSPWGETVAASTADRQIPFAAVYRPFLTAALERLAPAPAVFGERLDPAIFPSASRTLLVGLSRLASPVLARAFDAHLRSCGASANPSSSIHHDAFVETFGTGPGWSAILMEFPVLAQLMATVCLGWARETREFLARLDTDWDVVRAEFFSSAANDASFVLRSVRSDVSDRHGGAGVVRVLEFSTGHRLVYKRRPLDLEADFGQLLRMLKAHGLDCAPPSLQVLPRAGYGWVEHADAGPVEDLDALDLWFRKAGGLLCLMHLLGGTDGHMENVVATSAGPVLIDLETLLQPQLSQADQPVTGTFALAARQVRDSVLRTGLLPLWQRSRQGGLYDIGGLTGAGGYESPMLRPTWENIGSDAVRVAWRRGIARGLTNLPSLLEGTRHSAAHHLPALCAGFSDTWRFLQLHRDLLTQTVSQWGAASLRVLLRPTTHYAALFERSCALEPLRFGIDRSLTFEALRRPFVQNHADKPPMWAAVDEEIRALEDGDIPIFFVRAGSRDLEAADGHCVLKNAFGQPALAATLARLEGLDEANRVQQVEMIAAAFINPATASTAPPREARTPPVDYDALLASTPLASDQGLINTATVLGHQIINAAIRGQDGFVTWMAPAFLQPDQRAQRGVSYYLYDGAAGIGLFLAALAKVTGLATARETALAALEPIRAILDSANAPELIQREGLGGCSGLGSLVYTLTAIARLLEVPELLERAQRVSQFIDDDRITRDQALDVVSGSAGAIFALLALHRASGSDEPVQRAVACGRHLLARAEHVGDDALAWPSWPDRLLLAGYSHGAAGQSAALAALFKATGDTAFAEAAAAGLRYERGLFDAEAGNWPILLPGGHSRLASTWCHGAPGVLLSRLGMLGQFGDAEDALLHEEINVATQATLRAGLSSLDHLCCGTMGRVEILHLAASKLAPGERHPRMLDLARLGATLTIRRAQERKAFSLQADPVCNSVFQPGFFRGTSGLGYAFLRLARPDLVPSVFTWEA